MYSYNFSKTLERKICNQILLAFSFLRIDYYSPLQLFLLRVLIEGFYTSMYHWPILIWGHWEKWWELKLKWLLVRSYSNIDNKNFFGGKKFKGFKKLQFVNYLLFLLTTLLSYHSAWKKFTTELPKMKRYVLSNLYFKTKLQTNDNIYYT